MDEKHDFKDPAHLGEQVLNILDKLADSRDAERGSLVNSRRFDTAQLAIEADFQYLLFGLGRPGRNGLKLMQGPVLSRGAGWEKGKLELAEALPEGTYKIKVGGDNVPTDKRWSFNLADAWVDSTTKRSVIYHPAIRIDTPPPLLLAVDAKERLLGVGYARIDLSVK